MRQLKRLVGMSLLSAACAMFVTACLTFPEEYVPPEKVVFLRQPFYLVPVRYAPESAAPYAWDLDPEIDRVNPSILAVSDFKIFLKPDLRRDAKIYKEIREHLLLMQDNPIFSRLSARLNELTVPPPAPRKVTRGEQTKSYSNGTEYIYPEAEGASIVIFTNGDIKILFPDGRTYVQNKKGDYFEKDGTGTELYAFFAADGSFRVALEDGVFTQSPDQRSFKSSTLEIVKTSIPTPQYSFAPAGKKYKYVFFYDDFIHGVMTNSALIHDNQLRCDYFPDNQSAMVTFREEESIIITQELHKSHHYFNPKTRRAEQLYSYYFPEGIRIKDIHQPLTRSEVVPNWPEKYLEKKVGPFRFLYVKTDEGLLSSLDPKKLLDTKAIVAKMTGINFPSDCVVILPPDLASYRRLHVQTAPETLIWYPSGFQTKDIIIMWPPSLPRYEGERGREYFLKTELYEILVHELVHLVIGEVTGVFSPVPVWLNEGLAVYVESRYSSEAKKYWDVTYDACRAQGKLLSWDEATVTPTSRLGVDTARTHYAQSYKMVEYLIETYGIRNVYAYLISFKLPFEKKDESDLVSHYKDDFIKVFHLTWEASLEAFERYCRKESP